MKIDQIRSEPKSTTASLAFLRLKEEIQTGVLRPGFKLNIRALCNRFDVGLSPMREALNRLSAENLVQQRDNRGFTVTPVSLEVLMDITRARCWIDEIGLRESIKLGDLAWEETLLLSCHRLARTPRMQGDIPNPEWEITHRAFHNNLVAACDSAWLRETSNQLLDKAERYRSLARNGGLNRHDPKNEHQEIADAAIWRKPDQAVALLHAHYRTTADMVRSVIEPSDSAD